MIIDKITAQEALIDLNLESSKTHTPDVLQREIANEFRENDFCSTDGLYTSIRIPKVRRAPRRQLQGQELRLLGSISHNGFCSTNLSREPARYRSLPPYGSGQTLSHGLSLSNANQVRDWRIYADFAQVLISLARSLYINDDFGIHLKKTVYAPDATPIDLCLSLFPWARFRKNKAAVKLHTLLDLRGSIPTVIIITDGKTHEVNVLDQIIWEAGAIYLMDRGYLDFSRLYNIHQSGAFFITRARKRFDYKRILSMPADKIRGVKCDQAVTLKNFYPKKGYPERLRRIHYFDSTTQHRLIFLINNFRLSALTIADLCAIGVCKILV
jgi:hypothetical protein